MGLYKIKCGLNLVVAGEPVQTIHPGQPISRVALLGADYVGLRPVMRVALGDIVKRGQPLFSDESTPGVVYTAPGAGRIAAINYDEKHLFQSIVIELSAGDEQQPFSTYAAKPIPALSRDDVRALLIESGLWTAFRVRPFGRVPAPAAMPDGIFITAMDTEPLAPKPEIVIQESAQAFDAGLAVLAKLREGYMYLCVAKDSPVKAGPYSGITTEQFEGAHPAGTPGVHIHTIQPVDRKVTAWHIGYPDVIRIGKLFTTGQLSVEAVVALAGPAVKSPRLVRTRVGASLGDLTRGELTTGDARVLSGGVISGRIAHGDVKGYLGRHDRIVAACAKLESLRIQGRLTVFDLYRTSSMGMRPGLLLRALDRNDAARAEQLGCLELDENDLAFFTFGRLSDAEYGLKLRRILNQLESRG